MSAPHHDSHNKKRRCPSRSDATLPALRINKPSQPDSHTPASYPHRCKSSSHCYHGSRQHHTASSHCAANSQSCYHCGPTSHLVCNKKRQGVAVRELSHQNWPDDEAVSIVGDRVQLCQNSRRVIWSQASKNSDAFLNSAKRAGQASNNGVHHNKPAQLHGHHGTKHPA